MSVITFIELQGASNLSVSDDVRLFRTKMEDRMKKLIWVSSKAVLAVERERIPGHSKLINVPKSTGHNTRARKHVTLVAGLEPKPYMFGIRTYLYFAYF